MKKILFVFLALFLLFGCTKQASTSTEIASPSLEATATPTPTAAPATVSIVIGANETILPEALNDSQPPKLPVIQ